jgi:hypothetical protein
VRWEVGHVDVLSNSVLNDCIEWMVTKHVLHGQDAARKKSDNRKQDSACRHVLYLRGELFTLSSRWI